MQMCQSLGRNILVIDKYFRMYFKNSLKQYGLNTAEGLCLLSFYEEDGRTQEQLIDMLHYDKGVMTRTMQSLEEKGMLSRMNHEEDSRSYLFYLTKKGLQQKPMILRILRKWNEEMLADIPDDTLSILEKNLADIAETVSQITPMEWEEKINE